jgi:predicted  nucleic acid-binding Zn-ribbon protein
MVCLCKIYKHHKKVVCYLWFIAALFILQNGYCILEKYPARTEISLKGGKNRSIVRPGIFLPIYQHTNTLVHITGFGLADTAQALEGNIGVGLRSMQGSNILGVYAFYDYRYTSRKNSVHQMTIGAELFREYLEFRANLYIPQTKKFPFTRVLKTQYQEATQHRIEISTVNTQTYEQGLMGFDFDVGGQFPGLETLTTRVAYYAFGFNSSAKTRHGFRVTTGYEMFSWLELEGELSYDNARKINWFLGGKLHWNFTKNGNKPKLTRFERKMISLPIRDIDIVEGTSEQSAPLESLSINWSNEDVSVLLINLDTMEIVYIDRIDGVVKFKRSTIGHESRTISEMVVSVMIDDRLDTTLIVAKISKGKIFSENIYETANMTKLSHDHKMSDQERQEFANLVNVLSPSAPDVVVIDKSMVNKQKVTAFYEMQGMRREHKAKIIKYTNKFKRMQNFKRKVKKNKGKKLMQATRLKVRKTEVLQFAKNKLNIQQEIISKQAEINIKTSQMNNSKNPRERERLALEIQQAQQRLTQLQTKQQNTINRINETRNNITNIVTNMNHSGGKEISSQHVVDKTKQELLGMSGEINSIVQSKLGNPGLLATNMLFGLALTPSGVQVN